ncbi:peptidylprolyl isomerase [Hyalangium versicolor]|uniref:peptidylprolyl isomerase n=1 Tax=Hyalangium versicolor TaxID=2861190 RepID=UPI00272AF0B2|nr:peptidylprolyl isomerase [Hyalangium versicolor]
MDSKKSPPTTPSGRKPLDIPLYVSPAKQAAQGKEVSLPQVQAPSLEGLAVTVPAPEAFTVEDVHERFLELARPYATERARSPTEQIAWGDEVLLNLAGYSQGKLIPFSVKTDVWLPVEPEPLLPGLYEAMVGQVPTEGLVVDITLPPEYPVEALRGTSARFLVHIQAAREVTYPDLESPEFLQQFGRGKTIEETTESIVEQMKEEHTQLLLLQARQQVLVEVAKRAAVEIPRELVDEEIRRRWGATEGVSVSELNFSDEEQEEALNSWLQDESLRDEVEMRLRIGLALGAIVKRDGLTLTPAFVEKVLLDETASQGLTPAEVAAALKAEPELQSRIEQVAWHLLAVDHVMKKAKIEFEGA